MKVFMILCVLFVGIFSESDRGAAWKKYKSDFGKKYSSDGEEAYRRNICKASMDKMDKHNREADLGKHTYKMGVNKFCDLTDEEFKKVWLSGVKVPNDTFATKNDKEKRSNRMSRAMPPPSLDLRNSGGVSAVRNQGSCGSCWTFSAVAAIEFAYWKKTKSLMDLSEQQLVDCTYVGTGYPYGGCKGGWMSDAFTYISKNGGIASETEYPYKTVQRTCLASNIKKFAQLKQTTPYGKVATDDNSIKNALYNIGVLT
ncbi:unnamed protein product, partial [Rotaria sordida]